MSILRNVLAVVAGFGLWSVLWVGGNALLTALMPGAFRADGSTSQTGALVLLAALSVAYSVAAGYLTATIARAIRPIPVLVLGGLLLIVGIVVEAGYWDVIPLWYHLTFLALLIPAALSGGWLRRRIG